MKLLVWLFLAGLAGLAFLQVSPPGLVWLRAWVHEPDYSAPALTDARTLIGLGAITVACAGLFVLMRRLLRVAPIRPARALDFVSNENGALIFEFALVFPFILSLVFIVFQWAELLMVDRLAHYAAFVAARSASSWAADARTGPRYVIANNDPKHRKMVQAATLALHAAMALEGTSANAPEVLLLATNSGQAVPGTALESTVKKSYRHVGVEVNWGLKPRWPVIGLFLKPILEGGRIPISRSYRIEVEPYVESNRRFPFDMVFREEKARKALHEKVFPANHHANQPPIVGRSLTNYHARTVTRRKKGDMTECTWIGLGGREPCCPANAWGQIGQIANPFGDGINVPPE